FGGRIAEEMFCSDVNTGALGDIRMATSLARRMTREWGMNERVGFVFYGDDDQKQGMFGAAPAEYSQETAKIIDEEVKKLIDRLYEETRQFLDQHREQLDAVAKALMKYETLDSGEVERIMAGEQLTRPTVSELLPPPPERKPTFSPPPPQANPDLTGLGGPVPQPG
ncbi:MAG TPA: hypothetical protein VF624_05630, partial [Tepidisphaeraceae bacterium]